MARSDFWMEQFLRRFEQHPQILEYLRNKNWDYDYILKLSLFPSVESLLEHFIELEDEDERYFLAKQIFELRMEEFIAQFRYDPDIQTFLRNQNLRYDHILAFSEYSSVEILAREFKELGLSAKYSPYLAKKIISLRPAIGAFPTTASAPPIANSAPPIDPGEIETSAIITVMPIHPKLKRCIASCMLTHHLTGEISKGVDIHTNRECIFVKMSGKHRRIQTFCIEIQKQFPVGCASLSMGWTNFTDVKILPSHDKINLKEGDKSDITSGTSGDNMKVFATTQQFQEIFGKSVWEYVSSAGDSIAEQFGYQNFRPGLRDVVKNTTGIGENPEVRVHIKNLGEYKLLSKNYTTWEGCFDEFSDQPVSAVYVLNNAEKVKIGKPELLESGDTIEIEFKTKT